MITSPDGIYAIAKHEGIVPAPYRDSVGVWTYGCGHTAGAGDPDPEKMARGMPDDVNAALRRVLDVFAWDLVKYEKGVNKAFTVPLEQHEFDAAVSFHYNTGAISKASWVKSFNAGNRTRAIGQMLNWKKPPEIIPRRKGEQNLFANGVYPTGDVPIYAADANGNVLWSKKTLVPKSDFLAMFDPKTPPAAKPKSLLETIVDLIVNFFRREK